MATKLRTIRIIKPLFFIRDWFMTKSGLFSFKKKVRQKFFFRKLIKEDNEKKKIINKRIYSIPNGFLKNSLLSNDDIVVSLTSYGDRVTSSLPYALYSLIDQSVLPQKIVVYLDWDNWSDENIPHILKKLKEVGVDFRYCEDLRSYKKLIPALLDFPNNPIVTVDDDFYYNHNYLKCITQSYVCSDRRTVLGQWGCIPQKSRGKYLPYSQWKDCQDGDENSLISFFGCCCCYPPHVFDAEILKKEIFLKLCPTADDIWFWIMEERQNIKRAYIEQKGYGWNTPVNRIEAYDLSQTGTLMYQNVTNGKNDSQLKALLNYYNME